MVLGDQAYDRGAWANRIGESEAGVGYLFGEGIREPLRVRAGWVPDEAIKELEDVRHRRTPVRGAGPGRSPPNRSAAGNDARRRCGMTATTTLRRGELDELGHHRGRGARRVHATVGRAAHRHTDRPDEGHRRPLRHHPCPGLPAVRRAQPGGADGPGP